MAQLRNALFLMMLATFVACSGTSPVTPDPDPDPDPDPNPTQVSYAATIQPIFNAQCVSCHSTSNPQNGVALNSYSATMASQGDTYGGPIVIAGNAAGSPLYDKLQANPENGSRMPQGSALSTQQIEAIRSWIQAGALNN